MDRSGGQTLARTLAASITVHADQAVGPISPLLHGQNVSHLCGSVEGGLDAQMLHDSSFEADTDSFRRGVAGGWHRVGFGRSRAVYSLDSTAAFNGRRCQRVEMVDFTNGLRGVGQSGLWITAGEAYHGGVHLRQEGADGPLWVDVMLRWGETTYAHRRVGPVGREWTRFPFVLSPAATADEVELWLTFAQRATLWVDEVSLVPGSALGSGGWRTDLFAHLVALGPTCLRWPGGWPAEAYRWREGVGDPDRRAPLALYYSDVRRKAHPLALSHRFGTREFIRLCRGLGAEPWLVVGCGYAEDALAERVVEDAADWVEYCNGPAASGQGRLRAAHGSPESFGVRWWEVGNEPWDLAPEEYGRRLVRLADAMRARDASIRLVGAAGPAYDVDWTEAVIRVAGDRLDGLAFHHYYSGDSRNALAEPLNYMDYLEDVARRWRALVPGRPPRFFVNEWNSNTTWFDAMKLKEALYAACFLNALERRPDLVGGAAPCDWIRDWEARGRPASEHSLIWYRGRHILRTPVAHVVGLYRSLTGSEAVLADVRCGVGATDIRRGVPHLDVAASRDPARGTVNVKVVNRHPEALVRTQVRLSGTRARAVRAWSLRVAPDAGPRIEARNTFERPDVVVPAGPEAVSLRKTGIEYGLPPHSVTIFEWQG